MYAFIVEAVGSGDSDTVTPGKDRPKSLVVQVVDEGSWTGAVKIMARLAGLGGNEPFHALELENLTNGSKIQGGTGAGAPGLYRAMVDGMVVKISHVHSTGTVSIYGDFVHV